MIFAGIDPGFKGGIGIFNNKELVECIAMPIKEDKKGKNKIDGSELAKYLFKHKVKYVFIEHVHSMTGQGISSAFSFGRGVGTILGVCEALFIEYDEISPMKWKKAVLGEEYEHDKQGTIDFVLKTYPNAQLMKTKRSKVPHDGMADAIAIGYFGLKTIEEIINNKKQEEEK